MGALARLAADTALALMQQETVSYAKRQVTWFAREPDIAWVDVAAASGTEVVAAAIEARMHAEGVIE